MQKYVLCKLRNKFDGNYKLSWIPQQIAKFGTRIKITNLDSGEVTDGWFVLRVYRDRVREKTAREAEQPPLCIAA